MPSRPSILLHYAPALSHHAQQAIAALCQEVRITAGKVFVTLEQWDTHEYILMAGVVRSFLLSADGKDHTIAFFQGGTILSPHVSRTRAGRSLLNLEALTDVTVLQMDARQFESLIEKNLEVRAFANAVLQQELMQKVNREIQLASWSAKARLEQFRQDFEGLENLVPHPMIASYLGITNVSLSRLRKIMK
ncbi:MAG: Crp/Fnr family transcriptional regulator [Saprospiraceae bacterium]